MSRRYSTPQSAAERKEDQSKIDEYIETKGVTLCPPKKAGGIKGNLWRDRISAKHRAPVAGEALAIDCPSIQNAGTPYSWIDTSPYPKGHEAPARRQASQSPHLAAPGRRERAAGPGAASVSPYIEREIKRLYGDADAARQGTAAVERAEESPCAERDTDDEPQRKPQSPEEEGDA